MHIPCGASQSVEILDFETALSLSGQGALYDRDRWLYVPDFYTEYRYILGTRGENPLICIGINPSTAEPDRLDPTLKSVQRIADGNGYDSFIMFNVYAQRATRPDDMDRELNGALHRANMEAFRYVLEHVGAEHRPAVWAAWGTIIEKPNAPPRAIPTIPSISGRTSRCGILTCPLISTHLSGENAYNGHPRGNCGIQSL